VIRFFTAALWSVLISFVAAYASDEGVYTLHVKGVVKALPGPGLASNEILVKHEPIPDYRDESGKVVGMMAMTMPFYLEGSVSLKGISVGDSIELVVEQRIKPSFTDKVVAIKKSPSAAQ
jgi:Cu/Ag efflux protein CusF